MQNYICATCGTQFPQSETPPSHCPICEDERQYIGWEGQKWTTMAELGMRLHNQLKPEEPGLTGIGSEPAFAIGQRALLVQSPEGNVLWDCITYLDEATLQAVKALGGISAIAISHPHYYSSMIEWSRAFDAPIYLHADDRQWVMRMDPAVHFWQGETCSLPGHLTLVRCGGHFAGGTVLHWPGGAGGQGALLSGDILYVATDRAWVSFMYSFPNLIPLSAAKVERVVAAVRPYVYDRIYSAWWGRVMMQDARAAVERSLKRYIAAITDLPE
jgi:hypothetical protein